MISFARLLGVPLFLYLVLVTEQDVAALVVLVVGGTSDWVDGFVARATGQVSRLGQLLDPLADRLYIVATLIALTVREFVPWQFTAVLLGRELVLLGAFGVLRRYGYGPPQVHYLGKAGTFLLLIAFPILLFAGISTTVEPVALPIGWSLALWGLAVYLAAGVLYLIQVAHLVRQARRAVAG